MHTRAMEKSIYTRIKPMTRESRDFSQEIIPCWNFFFRIQKCIHMHEQCNSFLQKVYFLKIVYTMSCNSYLQNTLFFSDNSFF